MVLVTLSVRPKNGYHGPGNVRTVTVDSSQRLEQVLNELQLPKKTTALYSFDGRELPLNSSVASHNLDDHEILESCSSPVMSALLSAVLNDFTEITSNVPEVNRTRECIASLFTDCDEWETWPTWSNSDLKSRTICLAMMKKVLQRDDRFANRNPPQCNDLQALHDYMQPIWREHGSNNRASQSLQYGNPGHLFKPTTKKGRPSVCWTLLQKKHETYLRGVAALDLDGRDDGVEAFVKAEAERRRRWRASSNFVNGNCGNDAIQPPTRRKRRLAASSPATSPTPRRRPRATTPLSSRKNPPCHSCSQRAQCICLRNDCVFFQKPSCDACFHLNHPSSIRAHEKIPLEDSRAQRQFSHKREYCPQYASGAFTVLCSLLEAMEGSIGGRRQLSLREEELKKHAQPDCRANLYDRAVGRGARNAFSCMEKLCEKKLVRKEMIAGSETLNDGKWSLLPAGEDLAKCCLAFRKSLRQLQSQSPVDAAIQRACNLGAIGMSNSISLVVDTREDNTYAKRLMEKCSAENVQCLSRELPAGDYLFTTLDENTGEEMVLPLVIERKSWSDLADSVSGAGKGYRRLDCVGIRGRSEYTRQCGDGRWCQLCRMKQSGCKNVMFIIEGTRCSNRDERDACSAAKRCQSCRMLAERHGPDMVHDHLEQVLYHLQGDHACQIHFTRSYNETIDSLLVIRQLLQNGLSSLSSMDIEDEALARSISNSIGNAKFNPTNYPQTITYKQFCVNTRGSASASLARSRRGRVVEWTAPFFVAKMMDGTIESVARAEFQDDHQSDGKQLYDKKGSFASARKMVCFDDGQDLSRNEKPRILDEKAIVIDDDSSDELSSRGSVILVDPYSSKPNILSPQSRKPSESVVDLLEESEEDEPSQDSIQIVGFSTGKEENRSDKVLDSLPSGSRRGDSVPLESSQGRDGKTLLLLSGMYEYHEQYLGSVDKVWQDLYRERLTETNGSASPGSSEDERIGFLALKKLDSLQTEDVRFVRFDAVRFWILWLEIHLGVIVHVARQTKSMTEMRSHWHPSEETPFTSESPSNSLATFPHVDTRAIPKEVAPATKECSICFQTLTNVGVEAMVCGHCFHSTCLRTWFETKGRRICPICNRGCSNTSSPLTGVPMDVPSRSRITAADSLLQESSAVPIDVGTPQQQRIREARLRRFDKPDVALHANITPPVVLTDTIMDAANDGFAESQTWTCEMCTLVNPLSSSQCGACATSNPFRTVADSYYHRIEAARVSEGGEHEWSFQAQGIGEDVSKPMTPAASATTTNKRKVRCAACGNEGHNRGTATPRNCSKFFDQKEVQLRQDKQEKAQEKARLKRMEAERLKETAETETAAARRRMGEMERLLAEERSERESFNRMRQEELKRLEKAAKNAERRARQFSRR